MSAKASRPEPGIATDGELRTAVRELREAVPDCYLEDRFDNRPVYAERLHRDHYATDEWTEVIRLHMADTRATTKTSVINEAMLSDAPVVLRDLEEDDERELTFYPTNQEA